MRLMHLSDLHIGKRLNEFSLLDDQSYILDEILRIAEEQKPDAVAIAGDIYDKSTPSADAVALFDSFISRLARLVTPVFVISGNHDSAERIAFGSSLMQTAGVYLSPVYNGESSPIKVDDEFGSVNVYMLPFIRPSDVRRCFPDDDTESFDSAFKTAVSHLNVNEKERNVIIAHQFITGAAAGGSESVSVGGLDNISAEVFAQFDYAALGHIHHRQNIMSEKVRYSGTPLKYSFSEVGDEKTVTIADIGKKGKLSIEEVPLCPMRDLREIKGTYLEITDRNFYDKFNREDYIYATLTDENDIPEAIGRLRAVYPNIMKLDYDNTRTRENRVVGDLADEIQRSPAELFAEFYRTCNNSDLSEEQKDYLDGVIKEIFV
ncbi:MAG: exonuclease SbcCD subunit D [Oscillospiraceae bacterium]|nr:exonuclease SbcCD subunit D [Oscillospiraceae bacterium]